MTRKVSLDTDSIPSFAWNCSTSPAFDDSYRFFVMNSFGAVKDAKVPVAPMYCSSGMKKLELIKGKDITSIELPSLSSDISLVMQARLLEGYSLDV